MKMLIIAVVFGVGNPMPTSWDSLIDAVIYVESRGNDYAYNEREDAAGCLQIRPIMVAEANRLLEECNSTMRFTLQDRFNRQKSIDMFNIIASHVPYDERYMERVARRWNGGRRGDTKKSTIKYWKKVKERL